VVCCVCVLCVVFVFVFVCVVCVCVRGSVCVCGVCGAALLFSVFCRAAELLQTPVNTN